MAGSVKRIKLRISQPAGTIIIKLRTQGAVLLEDAFSREDAEYMATEAARFDYKKQPEVYGRRQVQQQVSSVRVPPSGLFSQFAEDVRSELYHYLGPKSFPGFFLWFNDQVIQRYEHASLGIQPHRDHSSNINLVVLCGLRGSGRFSVYPDLGKEANLQLEIVPGSILLLRAPGFAGTEDCPVHGVDQIVGDRYLLGLRQNVE
jgi:hypothetical protein